MEPFEAVNSVDCFPNFFGRPMLESGEYFGWSPSVDISETGGEYLIRAALPAVRKEDLKVTYGNGLLTLSGTRRPRESPPDEKHYRIENYYGDFSRSFMLGDAIDAQAIRAESTDGVLTVRVPKARISGKRV